MSPINAGGMKLPAKSPLGPLGAGDAVFFNPITNPLASPARLFEFNVNSNARKLSLVLQQSRSTGLTP